MELATHAAPQRGVDNLMLLDAGDATKRLANHGRGIVVAIAREIFHRDLRVRQRRLHQGLDLTGRHRHQGVSFSMLSFIHAGKNRSCASRRVVTDIVPPSGRVKSCPPEVPRRTAGIPAASAMRVNPAWSATATR